MALHHVAWRCVGLHAAARWVRFSKTHARWHIRVHSGAFGGVRVHSGERRTPSLRYSGERAGERAGERGEVRVESAHRSTRRLAQSDESNDARDGSSFAPLPCPLPRKRTRGEGVWFRPHRAPLLSRARRSRPPSLAARCAFGVTNAQRAAGKCGWQCGIAGKILVSRNFDPTARCASVATEAQRASYSTFRSRAGGMMPSSAASRWKRRIASSSRSATSNVRWRVR